MFRHRCCIFLAGGWLFVLAVAACAESPATAKPQHFEAVAPDHPAVVLAEFVFDLAPFPQCHASTIVETAGGLAAAWFGGTHEKHPDVGIWFARRGQEKWTPPRELFNGVVSPQKRYPTWNPVLFQPRQGPLLLFYKVGPTPDEWWGMLATSTDGGKSWTKARRLPQGILGPAKNKPVQLPGGDILSPSSREDNGWRVYFERSSDLGKTWQATEPINDGKTIEAIQPSILFYSDGRLQTLCRSKQKRIMQAWSNDVGKTWGEMTPTELPNPNSGTDAVTLADGRQLLVFNDSEKARTPLTVALSRDGRQWSRVVVLEDAPGKYSYPAVIQARDRLVHITYTWNRVRIKHVVLDPQRL